MIKLPLPFRSTSIDQSLPSPLHLLALASFAITQPLLDKLASGSEFFVAKQSESIDLFLFAIAVAFIPGALLAGGTLVLGIFSKRLRVLAHSGFSTLLFALILLPIFSYQAGLPGYFAVGSALILGVVANFICARSLVLQRFLKLLALMSIISPLVFLFNANIRPLLLSENAATQHAETKEQKLPSVIFLVFDEFPLSVLLNADFTIDAHRYPNFARLAQTSSWYRNATAISTHTTLAVPAILTGKIPTEEKKLPTANVHPVSVFSLLADTHQMHVWERITSICPKALCAEQRPLLPLRKRLLSLFEDASAVYLQTITPHDLDLGLPAIHMNWGGFWEHNRKVSKVEDFRRKGRVQILRKFINDIHSSEKPYLHFTHQLLPHMPYQFTSSGNLYSAPDAPRGYEEDAWEDNDWKRTLAYSQLMFQVGAVDTLIGELFEKLQSEGIFDSSLIIVTADHGVTFEPGSHRRGDPETSQFYEDILSIPLFVKLPQQRSGKILDRNVESIDILPTILDALDLHVSQPMEGISVMDESVAPRPTKRPVIGVRYRDRHVVDPSRAYDAIEFPVPQLLPHTTLDWKLERFGDGARSFGRYLPEPIPGLLGQSVRDIVSSQPEISATVTAPETTSKDSLIGITVTSRKKAPPFFVTGSITKVADATPLALALNGRIVSLSRAEKSIDGSATFQFLVPEEAYRDGWNHLQVLLLSPKTTDVKVAPLMPQS